MEVKFHEVKKLGTSECLGRVLERSGILQRDSVGQGVRCVSCMGESAADGEGKSSLCHSLQRVFMFTASMKIFQLRNKLCKTLIFVLLCSMAPHHFPLQYLKRKSRWQSF